MQLLKQYNHPLASTVLCPPSHYIILAFCLVCDTFSYLCNLYCPTTTTTTTIHPFNGLFSRTTWVSQYQKGKTSLDLIEARDYGTVGMHWHQLDHMQTICTSLQTDNYTNTTITYTARPDAKTVSSHQIKPLM